MGRPSKQDVNQRAILAAREYGISTVLFRHAVGSRLGVNVTDMECLALLFFRRLATPTELSGYTGLSSGATTAMLNRLEKAGLIIRRPNPKDGRGTLIAPDPRSVETVGPLFAGTREAQNELVASYSATELATIAGFLERFTAIWDRERARLQAVPPSDAEPGPGTISQ